MRDFQRLPVYQGMLLPTQAAAPQSVPDALFCTDLHGLLANLDLSDSPRFITFAVRDGWPSPESQRELCELLAAQGHVTPSTRVLIDLRDLDCALNAAGEALIAKLQAYIVATSEQHQLARQLRLTAGRGILIEIFIDEKEAIEWLWNADADW